MLNNSTAVFKKVGERDQMAEAPCETICADTLIKLYSALFLKMEQLATLPNRLKNTRLIVQWGKFEGEMKLQ